MTLRCLTSFAFFRDVDMGKLAADLSRDYGGRVELFADSGAFSVATTGATVKLADYAAWLRDWQGVITTAATLDIIGDYQGTARNTDSLHEAGLSVLPTFHVGTSWPVLEKLCASHPYLALGGMVPHNKRPTDVMRWLVRAFQIARTHGTVFHGFGQTRPTTLSRLPFYSVDSTNWTGGVRYGRMNAWNPKTGRFVVVNIGRRGPSLQHAALVRSHGADPRIVLRPGFCDSAQRSHEQYTREYVTALSISAVAFHRAGQWLQQRHQVPAPYGWTDTGTCLFLACGDIASAKLAAKALAWEPAKEEEEEA